VLADLRASDNLTIRSGCAVITLLLLTGCRYREILTLQWQDVKGGRLLLRDSKTGPRTVWLGSAAREVIDSLPRHAKILAVLELPISQADAVHPAFVGVDPGAGRAR
jgi:integrase